MGGTLEFLRLQQVCRINYSGHMNNTDASGRAVFDKLKIERGPQGVYGFQFESVLRKYSPIVADTYTFLKTEVANLEVLAGPIDYDISVGTKLPT